MALCAEMFCGNLISKKRTTYLFLQQIAMSRYKQINASLPALTNFIKKIYRVMFTIENELLKVIINAKGAELQSIFHKTHQLEYMWSGDPAFWAKKSPVLFPIVGTLKNDTYFYNNKPYKLGRHGFARDMEFEIEYE